MNETSLDPPVSPAFPQAAKPLLRDTELRANVRRATDTIQAKRRRLVDEKKDWQELRESARQIRAHVLEHLHIYLEEFEQNFTRAGGHMHWARNEQEAQQIVIAIARQAGADEVIKIKSMTTEEIHLNSALEAADIHAYETDLAELIIQLGHDRPSHIVVPALHRNRAQIREIFRREMHLPDLGESPADLAEAARKFLRDKFLRVRTAVSGANFLIAETGGICIVESEGNGRMCLTLPETLISVVGIEKVIPRFRDLEVFLQVLARSATGERMNPYTSIWSGVTPSDGPRNMHVVLLDNVRTSVLADSEGRQTLQCIRCAACQNACPVYRQTGGHAYGSVYAGPIGAILTPQLMKMHHGQSLPYASSLCGACYEVCPVKINIPEVLIHLRNKVVQQNNWYAPEALAMKAMAALFRSERRFRAAQRLARMAQRPLARKDLPIVGQNHSPESNSGPSWVKWLPGVLGGWTASRDLRAIPRESFREWWESRRS